MTSMSQLPNGLITFGPLANCTLDLCPLELSLLRYRPSIPATAVFIAIFGLSLAVHAFQGIKSKTWGFMSSMLAGCILEIIGYVGRIIIYNNPFDFNGFLMQITAYFYWVFIPSDIVSLVLQAVGGALSCTGADKAAIKVGEHISLAGLIFQVVTLICFCTLFADYVARAARSPSKYRLNKSMRFFLIFLFFSTVFILIRCAYRIAELGQGYFSALFRDEGLFIGLESCMMCVAVLLLNAGHPGFAFDHKEASVHEKDPPFESLANETNEDISMSSLDTAQRNQG
ncbi:hypothetical protein ACHAPT_001169 [Fusarium lateritium]